MALYIADACTGCNLCLKDCPNKAIDEGDGFLYVIDADKCTECVGLFDIPQCIDICPIECIFADPNHVETEAELLARTKVQNPDVVIADSTLSHFHNPEFTMPN